MMKAAASVVTKPVKAYQNRPKAGSTERRSLEESATTDLALTYSPKGETYPARARRGNERNCMSTTKIVTVASASGVYDFFKHYTSSLVVIPVAFTEGLRNVPRLYGEDVRDLGEVRDWKSGTTAGAKVVVYGIADGVSDMFVLPYQGGQRDGAKGAIKGFGKGVAGMTSKLFAGTVFFCFSYPPR